MNINELMFYIEKRPQMYFREKNVYYLEAFLGGFFVNEFMQDNNLKKDFRPSFYE
ncbi:hypothetical protein SAMN05880574_10316 [Chryseobacterium sp. RU37D]|nr:hypothetical protein SAMN05880574_10316 [Chryseobacterium sp. RU37D]